MKRPTKPGPPRADVESAWEAQLSVMVQYYAAHGRVPPHRAGGSAGKWGVQAACEARDDVRRAEGEAGGTAMVELEPGGSWRRYPSVRPLGDPPPPSGGLGPCCVVVVGGPWYFFAPCGSADPGPFFVGRWRDAPLDPFDLTLFGDGGAVGSAA